MIKEIGYDAATHQLEIVFTNGPRWIYDGVMPYEYETIISSPSVGKAFISVIRDSHPAKKIG